MLLYFPKKFFWNTLRETNADGVGAVVKVQGNGIPAPLIIGRQPSCISKFVQIHTKGRRDASGTAVYDRMTTYVQNNWSLINHEYRLRKKDYRASGATLKFSVSVFEKHTATNNVVRRILVRGSMPPCRLKRRKFWKFDYEVVHAEVYLNKYVVSIAPFSTPACPDINNY